MSRLLSITVVVLTVAAWASVPGCRRDRSAASGYDKIVEGMTVSQVERILGPARRWVQPAPAPPQLGDRIRTGLWRFGKARISVTFIDGKVATKAMTAPSP